VTLYFGCIDFVVLRKAAAPAAAPESGGEGKKVKCIVWDLDNTVWDGVLIEDGIDGVKLKPGIREVIEELDSRGILHSVASKNNHDDAMKALEAFGLAEYFLYPQVSWGPKSIGIQRIAKSIDIGIDTLLFVDDTPFERAEVSETVPEVRVMDALDFMRLPVLPECNVPVTAESRKRR
jgi:FkbH-like protein